MDKVKRITEIIGQIKEVTLDEFGWLLCVHNINVTYTKDNKMFVFKLVSDIIDGCESNKNKPVTIIQSFMDIVYTKYDDDTARYVEFNVRKNKMTLTKAIPDAISERDECFYSSMMPIGTYHSDIVFEAILAEENRKVTK